MSFAPFFYQRSKYNNQGKLKHSTIKMDRYDDDESCALTRRTTMETSMDYSSFMRTLEAEKNGQTKISNNGDASLSFEEATGNDTQDSKLHLQDLPSESRWQGSGFFRSFLKRMGSSRMKNSFNFRRPSTGMDESKPELTKKKRMVRFKFF